MGNLAHRPTGNAALPRFLGGRHMEANRRVLLYRKPSGRCRVHLIHAEEDMLRDWQPSQVDRHVISHRLEYTLVTESDKWMGSSKHQYLHLLRCQLPRGRHSLTDLKLSHPEVIPTRDRWQRRYRLRRGSASKR